MKAMVIGAHPDDAEYLAGGVARKFAQAGHEVKFVSTTNGDAGHQELRGLNLAGRRHREATEAAAVAGADLQILNHHDGRLEPTLENREEMIAVIRYFQPDLVLTHRPNDYHPDHRATARLVQDASYLLTVPALVPRVAHMRRMPVIAFMEDWFTQPAPFEPDVAVSVDDAIEDKVRMLDCHESQFYEWLPYNRGIEDQVPLGKTERLEWLRAQIQEMAARTADRCRTLLKVLYGEKRGSEIRYAEAFMASEHGRQFTAEVRAEVFPFFGG